MLPLVPLVPLLHLLLHLLLHNHSTWLPWIVRLADQMSNPRWFTSRPVQPSAHVQTRWGRALGLEFRVYALGKALLAVALSSWFMVTYLPCCPRR